MMLTVKLGEEDLPKVEETLVDGFAGDEGRDHFVGKVLVGTLEMG